MNRHSRCCIAETIRLVVCGSILRSAHATLLERGVRPASNQIAYHRLTPELLVGGLL